MIVVALPEFSSRASSASVRFDFAKISSASGRAEAAIAANPQKSDRAIAEELGVGNATAVAHAASQLFRVAQLKSEPAVTASNGRRLIV